jgi:curved DNA-binding protein CbpA
MGTLYDLLGALPSDDAEELRTAFRKAAKATHPDTNPDNPDAAVRFRELVRAYDILTDVEQRATYDHLLAIALRPPALPKTTSYEVIGKAASNTVAATIISAVLVGGYTLFGLFSKPPVAAEILTDRTSAEAAQAAPAEVAVEGGVTRIQRTANASSGGVVAAAAAGPAPSEAGAGPAGHLEPVPGFANYNLGTPYYPRAGYFDRSLVMYGMGAFGQPFADAAPPKRSPVSKKTRSAASAPRKPPPPLVVVPMPEKREPLTAAITP